MIYALHLRQREYLVFQFFDQFSLEGYSVSSNNKIDKKLHNTNWIVIPTLSWKPVKYSLILRNQTKPFWSLFRLHMVKQKCGGVLGNKSWRILSVSIKEITVWLPHFKEQT